MHYPRLLKNTSKTTTPQKIKSRDPGFFFSHHNSKMKITLRLTNWGGVSISSDDEFLGNTIELCSSSSNPFMMFDHHIMVIDAPRSFLEYMSSFDRGVTIDEGRSKTYSHIFCWKRFIRNHNSGWSVNLLHDPNNIFNEGMMKLCSHVNDLFDRYKKTYLR